MSKEREIDDSELTEISGTGEFVKPDSTTGDETVKPADPPTGGGGGGPGPGGPHPIGGGGGGIQEPNMD